MLDVSKIGANKLVPVYSVGSVPECLTKIVDMSNHVAQSKDLIVKLILDNNIPPFLEFDYHKLSQVLINIISNAIKFTATGRVIVKADWINVSDPDIGDREMEILINKILLNDSEREIYFEEVEGKISKESIIFRNG